MDERRDRTVGILGGMGPGATVDFMARVIRATPARDDEDHIRMLVDNDPKTPSRMRAVLEHAGPSPGPYLAEMARNLERFGADVLAMPCNTAHLYYEEIAAAVGIPFLNMPSLAAAVVVRARPRLVGLLASNAVLETDLYARAFRPWGVPTLTPGSGCQARLMGVIRSVKSGATEETCGPVVQAAAADLLEQGARAVVIACTEISMVASCLPSNLALYDASQILAEAVVRCCKGALPADDAPPAPIRAENFGPPLETGDLKLEP